MLYCGLLTTDLALLMEVLALQVRIRQLCRRVYSVRRCLPGCRWVWPHAAGSPSTLACTLMPCPHAPALPAVPCYACRMCRLWMPPSSTLWSLCWVLVRYLAENADGIAGAETPDSRRLSGGGEAGGWALRRCQCLSLAAQPVLLTAACLRPACLPAGFAWMLLGERLGVKGFAGAAIILASSLVTQVAGGGSSEAADGGDKAADQQQLADKKTE